MALTSDQFQLLIQRQEQRFRKSQLDFIDKLHAKLLNHPCFGGATEVDALISKLRTELENDYRTNEYAGESLNESIQSNNLSAAVIHDQPSNPVLPVSETCPVHGPSLINPETKRASNESSSSQRDNILLSAIKIAAVPAHEETENKSSSVLNTEAPNEINHDTKNVSNESNDQNSVIVLPDLDYFDDSYVSVEFSYKNERKMSDVLNDNQESNTTLIDTDYPNDSLSTNEVPRKFKETISEESNVGDLESNVVDPHDLFSSNAFPVKCDKHIALIVIWLYEDPTVFRGGG